MSLCVDPLVVGAGGDAEKSVLAPRDGICERLPGNGQDLAVISWPARKRWPSTAEAAQPVRQGAHHPPPRPRRPEQTPLTPRGWGGRLEPMPRGGRGWRDGPAVLSSQHGARRGSAFREDTPVRLPLIQQPASASCRRQGQNLATGLHAGKSVVRPPSCATSLGVCRAGRWPGKRSSLRGPAAPGHRPRAWPRRTQSQCSPHRQVDAARSRQPHPTPCTESMDTSEGKPRLSRPVEQVLANRRARKCHPVDESRIPTAFPREAGRASVVL